MIATAPASGNPKQINYMKKVLCVFKLHMEFIFQEINDLAYILRGISVWCQERRSERDLKIFFQLLCFEGNGLK